MNRKKFNQLIQNASISGADDLNLLQQLQQEYPYSQIIHALSAKSHILHKNESAKLILGQAAIYSTDRTILKNYIGSFTPAALPNTPPVPAKQTTQPIVKAPSVMEPKKSAEPVAEVIQHHEISDIEQIRLEIMQNLKELVKTKELVNREVDVIGEDINEVKKPVRKKPAAKKTPSKKANTKTVTTKKTASPKKKTVNKKNTRSDQHTIIDSFIEKEPRISKPEGRKLTDAEAETIDLARESVSFNDNLVSENLAVILEQQGKNAKAIEIYRKLIWKYPQKKTYFAAQIEKLENQ